MGMQLVAVTEFSNFDKGWCATLVSWGWEVTCEGDADGMSSCNFTFY